MFITKKHISPAHVPARGWARPSRCRFLDAMVPARTAFAQTAAPRSTRTRLVCIEMVHGAAGSTALGVEQEPLVAGAGRARLRSGARRLSPLEPFRDYLTIVSNTDVREAEAFTPPGDRRRPLPLERRVPHAVASEADRGLRHLRRHVARPALRAALRPGHADSVDAARASRTSIRPAAAPTATRASTPTRSAGRRRPSRCR